MKIQIKTLSVLFFIFSFVLNIAAQEQIFFKSGEGSFKINLPKNFTSSKQQSFREGSVDAYGKLFEWTDSAQRIFQVHFFKLIPDENALTQKDKNLVLTAYNSSLTSAIKAKKIPFDEKPYFFNKNAGKELSFIIQNRKLIFRNFIVGKRLYSIGAGFSLDQDEKEFVKILDSFELLTFKEIYDAKLEEAEPKPLPQNPAAEKLKSDAEDKNLRGKVKSVVEYTQESRTAKKEISSEEFYDENGNLTREVSYDEGYPLNITVWGNIDENRVTRTESIYFDDDQRPPQKNLVVTGMMDGNSKSNAPRDERYGVKHVYKYNGNGQLIESLNYQNNGELINRTVYNRKENQIEELDFDSDGGQMSKTIKVLDKNGNVGEERLYDADDKVSDKHLMTFEYDASGNWIVEKTAEPAKVKGKAILKPLWTTYRTITYYP